MAKQGFRRVKAGEISLNDLRSTDSLYITDTDEFFEDSSLKRLPSGKMYDKGRNLRRSAVTALLDALEGSKDIELTFNSYKLKMPDVLFEELIKYPGVGIASATMLVIALLKQAPSTEHILGAKIHNELFVEYIERPTYCGRADDVSSLITVENAKHTARVMATTAIKNLKLKNKPTVEKLVEIAMQNTTEWRGYVGDTNLMQAECWFWKLLTSGAAETSTKLDDYTQCALSMSQRKTVEEFHKSTKSAHCLIGSPGTGKSTVITAEYHIGLQRGRIPIITSYTNKACLNLKERLPEYSIPDLRIKTVPTINSLLCRARAAKDRGQFPLRKYDTIIVDESSMVSSRSLSQLKEIYELCSDDCRILFVGDVNQLPPVCQYGTPFFNAVKKLKETNCKVSELTEFKRANGTEIYNTFIRFSEGGHYTLQPSNDVSLITVETLEYAKDIVSTMYKTNAEGLCCLAETNRIVNEINIATVMKVHELRREEFVHEYSSGGKVFEKITVPLMKGVRVVASENVNESRECSDKIAKSEFGTIEKVGVLYTEVVMDICHRTVKILTSKMDNIFELGYASTVHKYQGSESNEVIYVVENSANMRGNSFSTQKELKYVGLSRAKKKLDILAIDNGVTGVLKDKPIELHVVSAKPVKMCF